MLHGKICDTLILQCTDLIDHYGFNGVTLAVYFAWTLCPIILVNSFGTGLKSCNVDKMNLSHTTGLKCLRKLVCFDAQIATAGFVGAENVLVVPISGLKKDIKYRQMVMWRDFVWGLRTLSFSMNLVDSNSDNPLVTKTSLIASKTPVAIPTSPQT